MNSQGKGGQAGPGRGAGEEDNGEDSKRESWQLSEHLDCSQEVALEISRVCSRMY